MRFFNEPFKHSQFDSKIICFLTFFIQIISLTEDKMVPVQPTLGKHAYHYTTNGVFEQQVAS